MIHIDIQETPGAGREPLNLEWLDTNGMGGYASSTLLNCHTRKYHGLLVANLKSPPGRYVLLAKFEDSIHCNDQEFFLSQHQYPGLTFPCDKHFLKKFLIDGCPQFIYQKEHIQILKSIMMIHGEDCVLLRYDIESCPSSCLLRLKPFLAYRDYHSLSRENTFLNPATSAYENGFKIEPYGGMPPLFIQTNIKSKFYPNPVWYKRFEYQVEKERGFDAHEDLFQPGVVEIQVKKGISLIVSASTNINQGQLKKKWASETAGRVHEASKTDKILVDFVHSEDRLHMRNLMTAGRQFLINTPSGRPAVIAGYHWFSDWGRDSLISIPGLTFCCNRQEEGIAVLAMFGKYEKQGLLPNYFSENESEKAYNSVDASLWYFWAIQQMLIYTGEIGLIEEQMWPVMKRIIKNFMNGTSLNIYMNSDTGLLHAGDESTQLTWMDAIADGRPVTPRWGYAVEINALWYNAIFFAHEIGKRLGDNELSLIELTAMIRRSFSDAFWLESAGYLADCFNNTSFDASIRPNQILAVSLPYSPLKPSQSLGVVNKVKEHLFTPVGLRTLSPADKRYQGIYSGDSFQRDSAYHQGTVWPWLLAHFGEAYLKVSDDRAAAEYFLLMHIRSFMNRHMTAAGVGSISEIFDGDPPHRPNGCIAQAWSVAELIRLYSILTRKPEYPDRN